MKVAALFSGQTRRLIIKLIKIPPGAGEVNNESALQLLGVKKKNGAIFFPLSTTVYLGWVAGWGTLRHKRIKKMKYMFPGVDAESVVSFPPLIECLIPCAF